MNIIRLANAMAERGYRVGLVTFDLPGSVAFFPIDKRVSWHQIGETEPHGKVSFLQRLRLIWRCRCAIAGYGRGASVVCFHHGILIRFIVASLFLGTQILCSERNSLSHYNFIKARRRNLNFYALYLVQRIVVQFPSYVRDYPARLRRKITPIANPVLRAEVQARPAAASDSGRYVLLCVARLSHQKNLDILIAAFAGLAAQFPAWDLYIVGEGSIRAELAGLISAKNLTNRAFLPGSADGVNGWLEKSHLFCLPSKWEGFPNALAEALAAGLPAIGYAGCAGINELIMSGRNGLLVEGNGKLGSLQAGLSMLMANDERRSAMGAAARESMKVYEPSAVFSQWDQLLSRWASF